MKQIKVALYTLGCKLNYAEGDSILRDLEGKGFAKTPFDQWADIYIINTCSVTHKADKHFKEKVKKTRRLNPDALVVAIGCYAQLQPQELATVTGVDLVLGTKEKFKLPEILKSYKRTETATVHSCEIEDSDFFTDSYSVGERTRAFLKVQDGCDYKCSYCTIPAARGISRSGSIKNLVGQAKILERKGVKEIVLTGVNTGDYGRGLEPEKRQSLYDLLRALLKETEIARFRISSVEPNLLEDRIIDLAANNPRLMPHFHIPLQSGSDKILAAMRRRYKRAIYANRVSQIKELIPHACIGADVIVGFPGETEEDFRETVRFIEQLEVSYLHVFSFSERPGTEATSFEGVVPLKTRAVRSKLLRDLSDLKKQRFYENHLGETALVLFEEENKGGRIYGFTENYIKVSLPWDATLPNIITQVYLSHLDKNSTAGAKIYNSTSVATLQ